MKRNHILIYILVFISGSSVMAIEMAASRVLVPFFGNSLFVWANIIGVVMAALALGYYLGGWVADKFPKERVLMLIVLLSGIFTCFIPFIYKPVITYIFNWLGTSQLILGSLFSTLILFVLPLLLMGFVSPFSIRLLSREVEQSGHISGAVYALGTAGSLVGTFVSSFLLIPFWGTRETILFSASLLILISVLSLFINRQRIFIFLLIIPTLSFFSISGHLKDRRNLVFEKESPHQLIQIFRNGENLLLSYNEGLGVQSIYNPKSVMTGTYYDFFSLMPYLQAPSPHKNVLIIGHGGGTSSRQYLEFFKDKYSLNIDAVEIDKEVTKAAKKYFNLDKQQINIYNTDGRSFLRSSQAKYDIVIIDAFNNRYNIPFHLTTREFFSELNDHLSENGVAVINFWFSQELKEYFAGTLKSVFPHVYFSSVAPNSVNELIMVSNNPLDFDHLMENVDRQELRTVAQDLLKFVKETIKYDKNKILTDNKAPVELISPKI